MFYRVEQQHVCALLYSTSTAVGSVHREPKYKLEMQEVTAES